MAYICDSCGKGSDLGNLVSHAKNRSKTVRKPNLHSARVMVKGKIVRQRLCTKCLRKADRPKRGEKVVEKKVEK